MGYFVYIIYSENHQYYYKGSTSDLVRRLMDHNNGRNASTKGKGPWKLVFARPFNTKSEAMQEEKRIKRTNTPYIGWLIRQPFNQADIFNAALSRLD